MSNRYKDNQRSFTPKTIGQSIEGISKKFSHKYGKIEYLILLKYNHLILAVSQLLQLLVYIPLHYNGYSF